MNHLLDNNRLAAVVAGGVFMVIAAVLVQFVKDEKATTAQNAPVIDEAGGLIQPVSGS
jgi:hypothetical protein